MDTTQAELIDRVRLLLAGQPSVRERTMFGGRCFMVDEKLVVSAMKRGDLLVRIPPERHAELIAHPDVSQPEMGAGRSMGPGWVAVARGSIDTEERLRAWLEIALDHARTKTAPSGRR